MSGKQLLLDALKGGKTARPPWVPFVGVHGAQLIGKTADEYLKSPELIAAGLQKAHELYRPDGLPIVFDLQIEAEILGCELHWADKGPPSVQSHPMSEMEGPGLKLADLPRYSVDAGRMPLVLDALDRVRASLGDSTGLYGLVTGPFTLALHLLGNDIFLKMFDDPEDLKELLDFCAQIGRTTAQAYIDHGADVVAVVDPMTSQISPEHFTDLVAPALNTIFDAVRDCRGLSSLFVCGDATRNLEVMCATACDNVSIDENIPLAKVRDLALASGKSFGGNLKLTVTLLMGDRLSCQADALSCLETGGDTGFVLAPGCDLPYDVPAENLQAVADIVHDPYQREVAAQAASAPLDDAFDDIRVPDYSKAEAVVLDVVTLDSGTCAPCQYMTAAAVRAREDLAGQLPVQVNEHKITTREGVGYMKKLGVTSIPSICVDGQVAFSSIMPDATTLRGRVLEAARAKGAPA